MSPLPRDSGSASRRWGGFGSFVHIASLLLLVVLSGCAHRGALQRPAPETLPSGSPLLDRSMSDADAWLRHHLIQGEYADALQVLERGRGVPGDALWRALQKALILHRAGEFQASNEAFEWAETETDLRYTRSVSRAASSLLVSDRVLAFRPSPAEMGLIPYYRMLNYLALGDRNGASVEARKAITRSRPPEEAPGCREDAMVRYLAGMVLASAGERNDALVGLRQADRGFRECGSSSGDPVPESIGVDLVKVAHALGAREVADSAAARYGVEAVPSHTGELLLLVEHGFVAYRVEESLHVPIYPADVNGLSDDDEDGILAVAADLTARLLGNAVERAQWGSARDDHPVVQLAHALDGAYVLRLAWPGSRRAVAGPEVRVWVNDTLASVTRVGDLSALAEREMQAQRTAAITRMVARGIAKYLVSREAEKGAEKKGGEVAGFVMARLTNLAANELERADTRSWSLLPDRVSMVRAHLPAGEHRVRVEVVSPGGAVLEERDLGVVRVAPGELVLRSERVVGGEIVAVR